MNDAPKSNSIGWHLGPKFVPNARMVLQLPNPALVSSALIFTIGNVESELAVEIESVRRVTVACPWEYPFANRSSAAASAEL